MFAYLFGFATNPIVLIILLILALTALISPGIIVSFRKDFPILFAITFFLALGLQLPFAHLGWSVWRLQYAQEPALAGFIRGSYILLPFAYIILFAIAWSLQLRNRSAETSFGVAVFAALILTPALHTLSLFVITRS